MTTRAGRTALLEKLDRAIRTAGAQSVLMSTVVAGRAGIHSTDLECLDLLLMNGPLTAGALAELTGLTTGAITAALDRLESAGYVHRERDSADRRRVVVTPAPQALKRLQPVYAPLGEAMMRLNREFSDRDLAAVVEYLTRANEIAREQIQRLQQDDGPGKRRGRRRTATGRAAS
jgi:DNA-binding MarR family transcriptional regulator